MSTPLAGTNGRVEANGLTIWLDKWSVNPTAADIDATTFESIVGGICYDDGITGKVSCDIEFSGYWDADQNPHSNPPGFRAGLIIPNVYLYVNKSGNRRFAFLYMRVLTVPVQCELNGRVELSVKGKSKGAWSYPS